MRNSQSSHPNVRTIYALVVSRIKTRLKAMVKVATKAAVIWCSWLKSGLAKLDLIPGGGGAKGIVAGIFAGLGKLADDILTAKVRLQGKSKVRNE